MLNIRIAGEMIKERLTINYTECNIAEVKLSE